MINFFILIIITFYSFISISDEIDNINDEVTYINSKDIFFDKESNKVILGEDSYINNDEVTLVANGGYIDFKKMRLI